LTDKRVSTPLPIRVDLRGIGGGGVGAAGRIGEAVGIGGAAGVLRLGVVAGAAGAGDEDAEQGEEERRGGRRAAWSHGRDLPSLRRASMAVALGEVTLQRQ
jgi:hypothetical protein